MYIYIHTVRDYYASRMFNHFLNHYSPMMIQSSCGSLAYIGLPTECQTSMANSG